jgi:hypothetical protein
MVSCQEDICFDITKAAKSEKLPEEDAGLAWKRLEDRFKPKISSNLVLLKKELNLCALKRTDVKTQTSGLTSHYSSRDNWKEWGIK